MKKIKKWEHPMLPFDDKPCIQYDDLCKIGQVLATHSLQIFLVHIENCKICTKKLCQDKPQ